MEGIFLEIAKRIEALRLVRPIRIAIDGIDTSGKSMFADTLVEPLSNRNHHVIRATVDAFHSPRSVRYQKGRMSAEGFYRDSYDYPKLISYLLDPLGEQGSRKYRTVAFDYKTDTPVDSPEQTAPEDAILLLDGIFLLRPELKQYWDFSIFLKIDFDTMLRRAKVRDRSNFETEEELVKVYVDRYIKGERMYLAESKPESAASMVIDNTDYLRPEVVR